MKFKNILLSLSIASTIAGAAFMPAVAMEQKPSTLPSSLSSPSLNPNSSSSASSSSSATSSSSSSNFPSNFKFDKETYCPIYFSYFTDLEQQ